MYIGAKDFKIYVAKPEKVPTFECDDYMCPIISALNKKGYKTTGCCQGHIGNFEYYDSWKYPPIVYIVPYIKFESEAFKNFSIIDFPDYWNLRIDIFKDDDNTVPPIKKIIIDIKDSQSVKSFIDASGNNISKSIVLDCTMHSHPVYSTHFYDENNLDYAYRLMDIYRNHIKKLSKWVSALPENK